MKSSLVALCIAFVGVASPLTNAVDSNAAASGGSPQHKRHHRRHGKGRHLQHRQAQGAVLVTDKSHADTTLNASTSVLQAVATKTDVASSATVAQTTFNQVQSMPSCAGGLQRGRLLVNGPIPADFNERFKQSVAKSTGCPADAVSVASTAAGEGNVIIVDFSAAADIVHNVEDQAADPMSALANGPMRPFLVADGSPASDGASNPPDGLSPAQTAPAQASLAIDTVPVVPAAQAEGPAQTATRLDIDTEMPYGELEPFGREDTAQELSEQAIKESDTMVDQLERAEVAEEKRSVFRALTRLRGAAITSFDGIARSQTGNIDEYNKVHTWRATHPLSHLADEESDVSRWAFPADADF